jgi:hypothetical protein
MIIMGFCPLRAQKVNNKMNTTVGAVTQSKRQIQLNIY